tara:strand:+ start:2492 stop:3790 length:1299 start_codon:yes stop_codon:yes gene_type:complete
LGAVFLTNSWAEFVLVKLNKVAIIGAGPAGLMAAEVLAAKGCSVEIYERKPSMARKFLLAGRGGLNLTHSEDLQNFIRRYGDKAEVLRPMIADFPPDALRDWAHGLGQNTFVGSSGRVFPESFKASPLLRAWMARLRDYGVIFHLNHCWKGWDEDGHLVFDGPDGCVKKQARATLLALGGASWPRLGSDGSWVDILKQYGVMAAPLQASNCGFHVGWSDLFRQRFAGQPLKSIAVTFQDQRVPGEAMIDEKGIEGGAIYALSSALRKQVNQQGYADLYVDLKPGLNREEVVQRLQVPRGRLSFSNYLKKYLNLSPIAINFIMENSDRKQLGSYTPGRLADVIKSCPLRVHAPFSLDRAISSAGGVRFDMVDDHLMLQAMPGVFVAGEMLDWEAPTGGYLLQASFATGVAAAKGIYTFLHDNDGDGDDALTLT